MNHRNRTGSFALAFLTIGVHLHDVGAGAFAWVLLVLQFLVYPHLIYLRAHHAADPKRAELRNLLLDCMLLAAWAAALGFPWWIAVMLLVSTSISHTAFHGWRGLPRSLGAIGVGVVIGVALTGWHPQPATSVAATMLSITCMTAYLLVVADGAYARALDLHRTREQLREREQALEGANERLRRQIDDIHRLEAKLRDQAHRDPLTGLHNRRFLDAAMEHELARCRREHRPLSVVLIDIDHFKRVNDTHGHPAGDAVLEHLAGLLREQSTTNDVTCRYGGEEFLLLLPGVTREAALARAEACRRAFDGARVVFGEKALAGTLSVGVATCGAGQQESAAHLVRRADQALYRAKRAGRNCVMAAVEAPLAADA